MMRIFRYLFIAYVIAEVASLIVMGSLIGIGWTFLLLLATFVGGGFLIRTMGAEVMALLRRGQLQPQEIAKALPKAHLQLLAGLLLIIPGFASDMLALLALLPPVQSYASRLTGGWLGRYSPKPQGGVVIEGEAVEVDVETVEIEGPKPPLEGRSGRNDRFGN